MKSIRYKASAQTKQAFVSALLLTAALCLPIMAQPSSTALTALWQSGTAGDAWPALPVRAREAMAVTLHHEQLLLLRPGILLSLSIDSGATGLRTFLARIVSEQTYINGDRVYRAELQDSGESFPLILTVGAEAVFAHVDAGGQLWQMQAFRAGNGGDFQGWVFQADPLSGAELAPDYVIPNLLRPVAARPAAQPLLLNSKQAPAGTSAEARTSGISGSNLRIEQSFNRLHLLVGETLETRIDFTNISQESHQSLSAAIYFVLDDTSPVALPANCVTQQSAGNQRVMVCELGDFAPGQTRSLNYTVRTSDQSKPRVFSTVLVGSLRNDAHINVVEDIETDSDGDGISDYNERLMGTDPHNSNSVDYSRTIIDVMALYTDDAADLYGGQAATRINQLISMANQIYRDSGVGIILRPVHHGRVSYPQQHSMEIMLDNLTEGSHSAFGGMTALRERYGADLVMLFRPHRDEQDRCGLANVGGYNMQGDLSASDERDYAFSVIAIDCSVASVVAHELGHNMGLTHSRREDGAGGTLPYATGYGVDEQFVTVMAYPGAFNTEVRLPRFSSPLLDCLGMPCGVDHRDHQHGADAVRVLNLVRHQIAAYYSSRVPDLPGRMVGTLTGQATDARIASAASVDEGFSFSQVIRPDEILRIVADLHIDSRHIGQQGNFHVLLGLGNGEYLPYTAQGLATELWDGTVENLSSFYPQTVTLRAIEYLRVLDRFRVDAAHVGRSLQVFVAYSVPATGELIFTLEPLAIEIVSNP